MMTDNVGYALCRTGKLFSTNMIFYGDLTLLTEQFTENIFKKKKK